MYRLEDPDHLVFLNALADQRHSLGADIAQLHAALTPDRDRVFVLRVFPLDAQLDQFPRRAEQAFHAPVAFRFYFDRKVYADNGGDEFVLTLLQQSRVREDQINNNGWYLEATPPPVSWDRATNRGGARASVCAVPHIGGDSLSEWVDVA